MENLVGYKLVNEKTGEVVNQWGGQWGQCPGIPNPMLLPSGDSIVGALVGEIYQGNRLEYWIVEPPPPTKEQVNSERDRRVASGFVFEKNRYQSRQEDRENVAGAVSWASLAVMAGAQPGDYLWHGGKEDFVWIAEDNSMVKMDAQTVINFGKTLAAWKSAHIFAARELKNLPEIPADFGDDKYWPQSKVGEVNENPVV